MRTELKIIGTAKANKEAYEDLSVADPKTYDFDWVLSLEEVELFNKLTKELGLAEAVEQIRKRHQCKQYQD